MEQQKALSKMLACVLCVMMLFSIAPISALAAIDNYDYEYESATHTVFKHTEQTLAPGVTNYTNYAYTTADNKQMVYYVTTADLTRDDVVAQVAYKDMQNDEYGMDKLSNMVACANEKYTDRNDPLYISDYYTVVSACNGDGYNMTTGEPSGVFIMGGNVKKNWDIYSNPQFLAILDDGTAVIGNTQDEWNACSERGIREAIDVFGSNLVWNGEPVVPATGSYYSDRHSRTMVGVTADGKLVICVVDGRQEPFSCGASMAELAQIMIEAGCDRAFNLDGGGSTTFMAKNEGSNACTIQNRPSDGSERSISNGIIIASTAVPSDQFDHVSMTVADEYITVGTSTDVNVTGVSPAGTAAVIPNDITYEATNGTFVNGVFTASSIGEASITAKVGGEVVGSVTLNVVVPDSIEFASDTILIPYGKSATIDFVAKKGLNQVKTNVSNFAITYENASAGSLDGLTFTAGNDESITECGISATFVGTDISDFATLSFGKGSEVIFDFEDGTTNGFETGYGSYNYYLPNGDTFVATQENGKVHSGNYALGVNIDYTNSWESGYQMNALCRINPDGANEDIPFVGANKVGCWMYIPDEYVGLWVRWVLFPISAVDDQGNVTIGDSITSNAMDRTVGGTGVVYSFNESGWHYLSCDFSTYKGAEWRDGYYFLQFYISDRDGADFNYYAKDNPNINGNFTVYIDDITVDYSSVVDDRDAPVFSNVTYAGSDMSDAAALSDNANLAYTALDFAANVTEYAATNATGINASTAKAYIDGNEVACEYTNGKIAMNDTCALTKGIHTVKFSICDNQGNYASIIRKVNITKGNDPAIKVIPHDPTLDRVLFGSVYYVDIVAENIEDISSVEIALNLDSVNKWELEHSVVADGFTLSKAAMDEADAVDNYYQTIITRTEETDATGEQVLLSIPVRVWELYNVGSRRPWNTASPTVQAGEWTYANFKNGNEYWWQAIEVRIEQGKVNLINGESQTFTGEKLHCDTEAWAIQKFMVETQEGKDYKAAWNGGHIHSAHAIDDLEATCTEDGYAGRTFCDVCNSIVNWGTKVPATGHNYVDGECIQCHVKLNGIYEGKYYIDGVIANGEIGGKFYDDGVLMNGYILDDEGVYYAVEDGVKGGKYNGIVEIDGEYFFSKVGVLTGGWVEIDGEWYFYDENTLSAVSEYNNGFVNYQFEENGKLVSGQWYTDSNGTRYYYGPSYYHGYFRSGYLYLAEIDGKQYNFDGAGYNTGKGVVALRQSTSVPPTLYVFADDCSLIGIVEQDGIVVAENGDIYYAVNGNANYKGLCQDAEGNYYYISGNDYKAIKNTSKYITYTNGLLPEDTYEFGADGKIVFTLKQGVVLDDDGEIRYYVDDVATYAGLVQDSEGNYYYISGNGNKALKNTTKYITYTNGLLPAGTYEFGADGRLIFG